MFGILIAPLAALAAAFRPLAELGIRGIGATPALIALVLYSLLPIVANTLAGFQSVDPAVIEAARGMGMSPRRRLLSVEWPLALPVIVTGIRVVLVQNIGLVAIAALIGAGGLGAFIFRGMNQTAMDLVLLGAVPILGPRALASAIVLDGHRNAGDAPMIVVEGLTKIYGEAPALKDLDFEVRKGRSWRSSARRAAASRRP